MINTMKLKTYPGRFPEVSNPVPLANKNADFTCLYLMQETIAYTDNVWPFIYSQSGANPVILTIP